MAKRSLKSSPLGIIKTKEAFDRKGWTQEYLAAEVGLSSRQSIWKFFTGRPIERYLYKEICFKLDLNWEEMADLPEAQGLDLLLTTQETLNINAGLENWVSFWRFQLKEQIQTQCNILQSAFDQTQPLLEQIYVLINILPQPSNQRWLEVSDLQDIQSSFSRPNLASNIQEAIPSLDVVKQQDKLMILGKPGAGKTTFLQYLALQCIQGKYKPELIPIFIQLRTLSLELSEGKEWNLVGQLIQLGKRYTLSQEQVMILVEEGKFLLLIDGFDEVADAEGELIFKEINQFVKSYYKNTIYLTCRSGTQKYHFLGFSYVEISDFNEQQIKEFAQRWFLATTNNAEASEKAKQFLEQLEKPSNQPIRDLGVTPILLNLICSVFKEKASFPTKRAKLYQAGLDILLQRWDQARGIQRDQIYRRLSLTEKIKLLCQIAATTFEENNYFFESSDILYLIEDYLKTLPNVNTDPETLWLNSEAVLKAIEIQHGLLVERAKDIYSFSHLTFQEYLTARKIVASPNLQTLQQELIKLAQKTQDYRWREVILLTVSMLPNADLLVEQIRQEIDIFVEQDQMLKSFLMSIKEKVNLINLPYRDSAGRAFYFTLLQNRDFNLAVSLDVNFASLNNLPDPLNLDLALARALTASLNLLKSSELNIKKILSFYFSLDIETKFTLESTFQQALHHLKKELPELEISQEHLQIWWKNQGREWVEKFRQLLIQHRQIGYDLNLSTTQQELWQQYYRMNQFLVECLQSDCQITKQVRETIEDGLLLPP
ncbi:histidine kinase [Aphanothece hegewaldii CCALA 016]|uniref:Histidine kinase n=1 Tax=Aphanothece hegewaldii CCALA 016 TaxID=2107694 RepID=A0A2T1LTL3_9CHRO|nr:NACHT domain-containing NTPase [Aphanothece hegewaldii]PSF34248.1 histidine kinase [Aphanothece hegewaldii CCALA 016]